MKPLFFKTPTELRKWFVKNHDKSTEQWIGYYKKATKKESITWDESVEEAICFGWIDGLRKSIDDEAYMIRFTPRKPNSFWSLKNMKTIKVLIEKGLMHEAGLAIYAQRDEKKTGVYAFEQKKIVFSTDYENTFKENKKAWTFFTTQAPSYKRLVTYWVMSAKQEKTRIKRLNELINDSENHLRVKQFRRRGKN